MKRYLILSIMLDLLKKDIVKAKDLAEKYEISTRTVYRYLNDLETAGVPTITYLGKNGGIGIDKRYKLTTTYFTMQEKDFIINSIKIISFGENKEMVQSIINKLSL